MQKRGAYLYAVKFNVPVISLFVEQQVKKYTFAHIQGTCPASNISGQTA